MIRGATTAMMWASLAATLLLAGCNRNQGLDDLREFTETAYRDYIPAVDPLPPLKPTGVFIYTASEEIDPFNKANLLTSEPVQEEVPAGAERGPDPSRRKEPLEAFEMGKLKLVGVLRQDGDNLAIIRAPGGVVQQVRVGNYMGRNHGEITRIADNRLEVVELVRNRSGHWEKRLADVVLAE